MLDSKDLFQLSENIKTEIKTFRANAPNVFADNVIDLFFKTLLFSVGDEFQNIDGLPTRTANAFKKIYLEQSTKEEKISYFYDFSRVEVFLKKVLLLVNRTQYEALEREAKGFASYMYHTNINPNNIDFDQATFDSTRNLPNYGCHLFRVYQLRNIESHESKNWPQKELYENIESVLIIYLFTIYKNISNLRSKILSEPDFSNYLKRVIDEFESWQQRFVHITGVEKFEEIEIYAVESEEWSKNPSNLRSGKIDDLRKTIPEKSMVVLGDPGMGKSTTLQYIAQKDAKHYLNNPNSNDAKIPLYIELKLFSLTDNIIAVSSKKLGISEEKLKEYILKGKISLFLDGLNEVLIDNRKGLRTEIQNLIQEYPQLSIVVTSRPLAYYNEFGSSPAFVLQRMENHQVDEFLNKNCNHSLTRDIIKREILANSRFGKIVRVPLLLKMLINVVYTHKGEIPRNKTQIIKKFIHGLYDRETKKLRGAKDFRVVHRLLCYVAHLTRMKNESNVGWTIDEVEALLEKRIENSRFKLSAFEFLDISIDLNILVKEAEKYTFAHELYQEYFASEELLRIETKGNEKGIFSE
jgi:hypothetical protein